MNSRNQILDLFKGIAIVAVILYHAGLFTYGYLGVEIFLVIGGYLITKSIMRSYEKGCFNYWDYLCKRLVRLWPLALLITVVSLAAGYFTMLPDVYKNTCETAVGTSFFINNFVQYITAGNYWDASNDFKPLMHTWYLGVIFQFYVLYPLLFMLCRQFTKKYIKTSRGLLWGIFGCSLLFYMLPSTDTPVAFYLLPARLYEFAAGGLIALYGTEKYKTRNTRATLFTLLFLVAILLFINFDYDAAKVRLLLTVALSSVIILFSEQQQKKQEIDHSWYSKLLSVFIPLGIASYSLYLWHQLILAFYRNIISDELSAGAYLLTIFISIAIGYLSYLGIEKTIAAYTKQSKVHTYTVLSVCVLLTCAIAAFSVKYYKTQGVVRDIPELEVYTNDPQSWEPQEYNARITSLYEKPFPKKNGKKNVLVVGDSFARDWINVLLESHIKDVNLIYSKDIAKDLRKKISQADIIFVANNAPIDKYVDYLPAMLEKKFYRVGHKTFGRGISSAYNQAILTGNYVQATTPIDDKINIDEQVEFKGKYINLMDSLQNKDGSINLFTQDKLLISHDGIHLTRAGAKQYAKLINVNNLIR